MKIDDLDQVKRIFEAALMAADKPLQRRELTALFDASEKPDDELIDGAIESLVEDCEHRGYELKRVASGYRYQVRQELSPWVSKLWQERAPRYSRALLETLSLIAYRQPITRGEIEEVRGVAVSSQIIKTLLEREWVKIVGHRDVPGRPAIYATTREFLDYFNLKSLDQLPPLAEIRDLHTIGREFDIELPPEVLEQLGEAQVEPAANDAETDDEGTAEQPQAESPSEGDVDELADGNMVDNNMADNNMADNNNETGDDVMEQDVAPLESWDEANQSVSSDINPVVEDSEDPVEMQAHSGTGSKPLNC